MLLIDVRCRCWWVVKMSFEYGLKRVLGEVVSGIVTSVVVDAFLGLGLLPPATALLFGFMNMMSTVILVLAMPFWGTVYVVGWLVGLWIMLQAGLIGILDAAIYFGVPLVVLILRIWKKLTE
jgi:hypothetical protein